MKKSWSKRNLWDALPAPGKAVAGAILGKVPLERLLGRRFRETREFLAESQWWSREQNEQYQLVKLRETLTLADARSSFYRNHFRRVGFKPEDLHSLGDLRGLPTITKDDVVANLAEMMTCPADTPGIDYVSTGGSSGAPFEFHAPSSRSAVEYAFLTSGWERTEYRLGDPMAVVRGRVVERSRNGIRHEYDPLLRQHFYSNFHMNAENAGNYLKHIGTLGSCVLHAYSSSATVLARLAIQNPKLRPGNVKAVLLESEGVFSDQAESIRKGFGVEPFSSYGHSEKLVLACACESNAQYHVWPTYGYFELLNQAGESVSTPGERGEIVGTGFINTVVPMIRYRTGDFAIYQADHCSGCGRNHVLISDIEGRGRQACLIGEDESEISMTAFNMHDDSMRLVREYQFIQDVPGSAKMLVSIMGNWSELERKRVEEMVNRRLQGQVQISVLEVDQLHRTRVGKLIRVMSSQQIAAMTADKDCL